MRATEQRQATSLRCSKRSTRKCWNIGLGGNRSSRNRSAFVTSPIIFKNPGGFRKFWGVAEPRVLREALQYLLATGFTGPTSWQSPVLLSFDRPMTDDLFVRVSLGRVGEFPPGVFNFDSHIIVWSKMVGLVERALDLWPQMSPNVERGTDGPHVPILSVSLSHLKWNRVPGPNPVWQVTEAPDGNASGWPSDWQSFGEPFVRRFEQAGSAANCLTHEDFLPRSPWVLSDGIRSPARIEYGAILLSSSGRSGEAIEFISGKLAELRATARAPSGAKQAALRRCEAILDWINKGARLD